MTHLCDVRELAMGAQPRITAEQKRGLDIPWFLHSHNNPRISDAMKCGFLKHWYRNVERALQNNRESKRPYNWSQLFRATQRNVQHGYGENGLFRQAVSTNG